MKKLIVIAAVTLFTAFSLFAQDYKQVADGIEYAELLRGTEKEPVRMNLLRLDLTKVRIDVVHALDAAIGLEKPSSMAVRHGAIAAVNAGFFKMTGLYNGDATGLLQVDGKVLSETFGNRAALAVSNKPDRTEASIDRFTDTRELIIAGSKAKLAVDGLNSQRGDNQLIVYTPEFTRTTLTNTQGAEIVVRNGVVREIRDGQGSSRIPDDGFVISAHGTARERVLREIKKGGKVDLKIVVKPVDSTGAAQRTFEDMIGGVPTLIRKGKIEVSWKEEKTSKAFVETKHPRTAVAILKDGKLLLVTIDGRQPTHSVGIGLDELAALLLELGAVDAMNLDGGGSTSMFLDGKVVNKPSDKEGERSVSDAILVIPRKRR